jgi:VanZ family protein
MQNRIEEDTLERRPRPSSLPARLAAAAVVALACVLVVVEASTPNLIFSHNEVIDFVARKLGHLGAYGSIAFGAGIASSGRLRQSHATRLIVGGAAALGLLDEAIQSHVAGRLSSPLDVALDILGAMLGIFVWRRFERRRAARS